MKPASLIGHTLEAYQAARFDSAPADATVRKYFQNRRYLGSRDRRLISELVYGMLRSTRLLESYLREYSQPSSYPSPVSDGPFHPLLFYSAYALLVLRRNAEEVLAEIAPLWEKSFPEIEADTALRALARVELPERITRDSVARNAVVFSLPDLLVREWTETYGDDETEKLCASLNVQAPLTVRVNTLRTSVDECRNALRKEGVDSDPSRFSPDGLNLGKRFRRGSSDTFRRGFFEMQDEGSQLISYLANPEPGLKVIDACAGSGGKSLHLAALMKNEGKIIASDISRSRLMTVGERSRRAGVSIIETVWSRSGDRWRDLEGWADVVLIDAPCSGSGTFRRNPAAKLSFTPDRVRRNTRAQKGILSRFAGMLKPGGRLVYATCSLVRAENQEIVADFLSAHREFSVIPARDILSASGIDIRFSGDFLELLPHRHGTDGFFGAVMVRLKG